MLERPALYNREFYARLETLITDDDTLVELSSVAPDDDFVMELLWNAHMGNSDYPFAPKTTLTAKVPSNHFTYEPRHSWYEAS